jgi:micrococcal nuclease
MKLLVTFLAFWCGLNVNISANILTATVASIVDGNTVEIDSPENGRQKVVLFGVDCPELDQEYGIEAKVLLEKLILNRTVTVNFRGKDRWGNYLATVLVDDDDIRISLLKAGLAWTDEKKPDPDLEPYRVWAQKKGKGLWKDAAPVPPWTFRRQQSMTQPKSS